MTLIKMHSYLRKKSNMVRFPWLLSLGLSVGILGCSHPYPLSNTQLPPSQTATADITQPSNMIPSESDSISSLAQQLPITARINLNGNIINLEVATTSAQQTIGLMYRTSLRNDHGMLFPFVPPRPVRFWMRNVEMNLDMLFIQSGRVVAIESQVPPCRTEICPQYGPVGIPVDYVLEVRGGLASDLGVEVGELVSITTLPNSL